MADAPCKCADGCKCGPDTPRDERCACGPNCKCGDACVDKKNRCKGCKGAACKCCVGDVGDCKCTEDCAQGGACNCPMGCC